MVFFHHFPRMQPKMLVLTLCFLHFFLFRLKFFYTILIDSLIASIAIASHGELIYLSFPLCFLCFANVTLKRSRITLKLVCEGHMII